MGACRIAFEEQGIGSNLFVVGNIVVSDTYPVHAGMDQRIRLEPTFVR